MFGAKIRTWMENHIALRPRKKSNKNKNGNGNLVSQNTSNDYKGTLYQNEPNITSPARRSEVSPIQNHNTGRKGWQSPNQEIPLSPRPDYQYLHTSSATIIGGPPQFLSASFKEDSNSVTLMSNNSTPKHTNNTQKSNSNSSNTLNTTVTPQTYSNNNRTNINYLTTAPTTQYQMKELDHAMMKPSTPQIIVTSKSSTSINNNNNNNNTYHYNQTLHPPLNYSTATSSSNELLDDKPKFALISSSSSSVNSTVLKNQNESNNNVFMSTSDIKRQQQPTTSDSKYGKIQPINKYMSKYRFFSKNTIDQYNGNSSDDFCSTTTATATTLTSKNTNNNCNEQLGSKSNPIPKTNINCQLMPNNLIKNSTINSVSVGGIGKSSTLQPTTKSYRNSNNIFNGAYPVTTTATTLTPPSTQQLGGQSKMGYHVVNSVSSPESAYSTGYSTDGNSPGGCCSYSPEYYINIRTGIHYFPKGNNTTGTDASNRFKSGLNRIEEKNDEQQNCAHKRTESFDYSKNLQTGPQSHPIVHDQLNRSRLTTGLKSASVVGPNNTMSPILRKNIALASHFRTPSPRQRCRIRTNPWFSNVDPEPISSSMDFKMGIKFKNNRDSGDSATSSSGIKSNSDEPNEKQKSKKNHLSDSDSSTTEKNASKTLVSLTEFRKKYRKEYSHNSSFKHAESEDEDATLNEFGKFDESYVYEKENDILSDSDPTDCVSDLGQEAGDECDTDDYLLDIDYIDNGTMPEMESEKEKSKNTGNCTYHPMVQDKKKQLKMARASKKSQENPKKRKKILRKRSKNSESSSAKSPIVSIRGCRSVGGTPVSIRRNDKGDKRMLESSLSNRSNSLTFNEVHLIRSRMLAISESEKALIKADLEADVKYKQLIHEAETILISMKTNTTTTTTTTSTTTKDVPTIISSPRRVCNVPTNKRVEMLRNCEADLKRELNKTSNANANNKYVDAPPSHAHSIINKRLEILRYETSVSAPSSPKTNRVAPIKTHVTNFIYQNEITTELVQRRDVSNNDWDYGNKSPNMQMKGKFLPPKSPAPLRRRFLTPKQDMDSDSDSDNKSAMSKASGKENSSKHMNKMNNFNDVTETSKKPPKISFRSVVCNNLTEDLYFPQSEPLKRKIYSCNSTIDKMQRSLDFDSEVPKKALLQKIQLLRKERQAGKTREENLSSEQSQADYNYNHEATKPQIDDNIKRKLIMKTIEDIKRSLEDQSLELNELHDSDN